MIISRPPTTSPANLPIVEVSELTRAFGSRKAVAGVTFSLAHGDCLAVFERDAAAATVDYDA